MTEKRKRRFIAGARCPKCEQMDTLMLYLQNNVEKVECVACGHMMSQPQSEVADKTRDNESVIGVFKPQ